jgi:2-polyprenyl-6-methoxyphenol hydroxylase-like FAD-dependent oxidoreductase
MFYAPSAPAMLIVGAGPTGLTLAYELLRRGIKPRLIEKTLHASPNTKALGVLPRTLEGLAPAGITKEMLAQGVQVPTFSVWSAGRRLALLDFSRAGESPYPFILMIPQHTTEAILTDHVIRQGGMVERGIELVSLTQRAEGVEAVLRHANGTEEQTWYRFLIGCDGAHSTVRHLLGARFGGATAAQSFTTGDIRMHWNIPHNQALGYLHRGHFIAYFPLPDGQHRFLLAHPPKETPQGEVTLEEIQQTIDVCGPVGARATDPRWLARYHVHQRRVDCYVHQRVLLVGDAAHIHSPLAAQGMNTGIQDALNLAWKLSLIVQGRAPTRLLESYHIERAKVGARLLQTDALLTSLTSLHHPLATAIRDRIAPYLVRYPQTQQLIVSAAAGLRVSYRHGPLVFDYRSEKGIPASSAVKVGDRAPNGLLFSGRQPSPGQLYDLLTGTGHALLIFTTQQAEERIREVQSVLADWQEFLEVFPIRRLATPGEGEHRWFDPDGALAERYGIADEGLVLIRPDGYIGFRSQPIAAATLHHYLSTHFFTGDFMNRRFHCLSPSPPNGYPSTSAPGQ